VFSFPRRLRVALAKDGALWSEVLRACVRKVFVYQRRKARSVGIDAAERWLSVFCSASVLCSSSTRTVTRSYPTGCGSTARTARW
jgi:hypothetical protein